MNWLCNPTGHPDCFRAVDWVVERNNLYTKVRSDDIRESECDLTLSRSFTEVLDPTVPLTT